MYKTTSFKKKVLTTAIASAVVAAGFSGMAYAQDDSVEEVMVTGIRGSLTRAVDVKRNAAGVVDAISSEDLGKMPDSNLAESLQRITGISIDRTNGEGAKITSRGFGPAYNLVTLNGRQLSTAGVIEGGDVESTRSFDMSNIASESVTGVQVYKTGKASVPTGGIGATVNLTTAKPFDYDGFKASIGGKALVDQSNDIGDDVTPELSGFVSWSNDMFGASLSLTHQERDSARSGFANSGWGDKQQRYAGGDIFNGGYTPGAVVVNEPTKATIVPGTTDLVAGTGDLATRLQEANFFHTDTTRERDNALLTLQFQPTDRITATLDVLSVTTKTQSQHAIYSLWFSDSAWPTNAVQWDDSSISKSPLYVWQANPTGAPRDIALKNSLRSVENKLDDVGFNLAFQATDELSFELDVHKAESSATPWGAPGSNITLGIGVNTLLAQGLDMSGDLPLIASVVQNGSIAKSDVGSTISQLVNARAWQDVEEARISGKYEFSDSGSINFGLSSLQTESIQKQSDIGNATMKGGWSVAAAGDINPEWFELINFNDYFDGYNSNLSSGAKDLFAQAGNNGDKATSNITGVRVTNFNAVAMQMFAESPDKVAYAANPVDSIDRKIVEDIQAAYVEANLSGNLGGMEVDVSAGLRYETTDVESYSRVSPRKITWTADRDFNNEAIGAAGSLPYTVSNYRYNNVLPNLDLTFHISDELIARASSSKTISRANFNDLQMGAAGNAPKGGPLLAGGAFGDSTDGNVKLKPIESNNIDFSVEYYFNDTDYVSIGFFDKRVPNFIGTEQSEVTYAGTLDPSNGPRALAAAAALNAAGIPVTERNLFEQVARMNTVGCINTGADKTLCGAGGVASNTEEGYLKYSNGVDIEAVAGDPGVTNNTSMPTNSKDAVLNGWEFAGQHFFGDSGFGIQANYTIVNGSISYDLYAEPGSATQFALAGLSDSANLIGIFENDQWQARIAYNWRENFLGSSNVGGGEPEFTDDYGQVDFNVGYKVTDDLTVSFEGTNVLADDKKTYGRTKNQVRYVDILEARYALSARYNF
ncbi:MAG: TonB-dependent receptor [Cellvibrio sp.]|uniref:TonB-dependent receptor n=1 Tax=Cellvibrio sp. TaxID=1965322 RepID=UPI00272535A5|nr:TonB-dependent receptor [Cellvibrio sp.]